MKLYIQTKKAQNVFVTFREEWKKKDNCYLVFGDKNEVFPFFFIRINIKQGWLLHKKLKKAQYNRRLKE